MTTMTMKADDRGGSVSAGGLFGAGLLGGALSAVVNYALYFGASAAGVAFTGDFQPGVTSLPVPAIGLASIVPGLFAAILALILQKVTPAKAASVFGIIAAVFCVVSFGGPVNVKNLGTGALVVMELMHVVAAVGIGGAIWKKLAR